MASEKQRAAARRNVKMGATAAVLMNNSGADPHAAIDLYGREVLPRLSHAHAPA